MHIFGKRQAANCAVCGKELGRHRYKPGEGWGIEGLLCGDCHIEKTREFMIKEQETPDTCAICGRAIEEESHKPKWQWEMETGSVLCKPCFQKKEANFNKKINFCTICNGKLGMFYYHPKPEWNMQGNLCRKCWDAKNNKE